MLFFSFLRSLIVASSNQSSVIASVKRGTELGFHDPALPLLKQENIDLHKIMKRVRKQNFFRKFTIN